jgi:hypothetical protein
VCPLSVFNYLSAIIQAFSFLIIEKQLMEKNLCVHTLCPNFSIIFMFSSKTQSMNS